MVGEDILYNIFNLAGRIIPLILSNIDNFFLPPEKILSCLKRALTTEREIRKLWKKNIGTFDWTQDLTNWVIGIDHKL